MYSRVFQPQDEIEVGEDGFKQYDGKRWVCVSEQGALINECSVHVS